MNLIRRAPGDGFTLTKFFQTKTKLKINIDSAYLWSLYLNPFAVRNVKKEFIQSHLPNYPEHLVKYFSDSTPVNRDWVSEQIKRLTYDKNCQPPGNLYRDILIKNISKPVVLLGIKDHLTPGQFDPWLANHPWLINPLLDIFQSHPNKKFILLTSLENLTSYINEPNVSVIPWGGDISNHIDGYRSVKPIVEKNIDSQYTFLSLNRHDRNHRLHLISLLLSLGIADNGLISCMFKQHAVGNIDYQRWQFTAQQSNLKQLFQTGYEQIKSYNFSIKDNYEIYGSIANDNVSNFKNTLSKYYREIFVEFVAETSYTEKCFLITEKTANSILGCCFPIWISSQGTVDFLRSAGMDVFDDVVNHSYDTIENPVDRLYCAVTDNLELLTNVKYTKHLWQKNRHRFLRNVEFFRKDLWQFYNNRLQTSVDTLAL